ncbi:MAG: hypothetical protein ABR612_12790 [Chromatocurvus sp.]
MHYRQFSYLLITAAALIGVFVALVLPNRLDWIRGVAFHVFPLELVVIGFLLLLPGRAGNAARILLALLLGLSILLRVADLITHEIFARRFNVIFDTHLLADAGRLLSGTLGNLAWMLAGLLLVLLAGLLCWLAFVTLGRLQRVLHKAPRAAFAGLMVMLLAWGLLKIQGGKPRADAFAFQQLIQHGQDTVHSIRDMRAFADTVGDDPMAEMSAASLFSRLQGKDVFIVFAESYGRALLERDPFAESIRKRLTWAEDTLAAEGAHMRSAFLTAATVGGQSWLNHATLLSGAWIDSETRFRSLVISDRVSLNRLFRDAGWRTVAAMPAISMAWPEGAYYGYNRIYTAQNFGYQGIPFNWVTMPDQYVWSALQAREREGEDRKPVMAELALISSHAPWTPIAELVPWDQVGDGRIFNDQAQAGPTPEQVWSKIDTVRDHYRQSIEYMLETLVSYVRTFGGENLVLLVLGDHPTAPRISGDAEDRDVPIHLITHDPAIIEAIADWQWQPGMLPTANAPVWRMDQLRDRFIKAFSEPHEENH